MGQTCRHDGSCQPDGKSYGEASQTTRINGSKEACGLSTSRPKAAAAQSSTNSNNKSNTCINNDNSNASNERQQVRNNCNSIYCSS